MNENQSYDHDYNEITLREILEILLDGKKIIAIVTALCLLASVMMSFFIIKPAYEAKTVLLTADVTIGEPNLEDMNRVIESYNKYPEMTVKTYLQQIKAPQVLQATIDKLQLKDNNEQTLTVQSLAAMTEVTNPKDTNLIEIKVTHREPEKAAPIANTIGDSFIKFISENVKQRSKRAAEAIQEKLQIEEKSIERITERLKEYLSDNGNLTEMKDEMNALVTQTTSFKEELNLVENDIIIERDTLLKLEASGIKITIDMASLDLNLNKESEALDVTLNVNNANQVEAAVLAMKVGELQASLLENISRKKVLEESIGRIKEELITIQTKIAQQEYAYNSIQRDLDLANQAYNAYKQRHKEAVLTAATDLGSTSVVVSSSAIQPTSPVGMGKTLYMAIGLMLGAILGAILVFLKQYLGQPNENVSKATTNYE